MYLEYQNQNSQQTLREAIEEYHLYLTHIGRQILTDSPEDADSIWLYHDATHAIFGQDTTIEGEAALDFWVFLGPPSLGSYSKSISNCRKSRISAERWYQSLVLRSFPNCIGEISALFGQSSGHTRRMKKKWPFELPATLLDRRLNDLREEYGITVLTSEQKVPSRLTEFDYSIVSDIS